jgi:hypothetical protein
MDGVVGGMVRHQPANGLRGRQPRPSIPSDGEGHLVGHRQDNGLVREPLRLVGREGHPRAGEIVPDGRRPSRVERLQVAEAQQFELGGASGEGSGKALCTSERWNSRGSSTALGYPRAC